MNDKWTVREIAERCGLTVQYINRTIQKNSVPHEEYGRVRLKVLTDDIVQKWFGKYMEDHNE